MWLNAVVEVRETEILEGEIKNCRVIFKSLEDGAGNI